MAGLRLPRAAQRPYRCPWCGDDPLYVRYHDEEWGVPCRDDRLLFEMLCLEGQQAGLSWITVLRKRENYRRAFHDFDADRVATMGEPDIARCLQDAGLIRHRGKLEAIIDNARGILALRRESGSFADWLWQHVDGKPQVGQIDDYRQGPSASELSKKVSKALKQRGFRFVGPTTVYAFLQAVGVVNDHERACFRFAEILAAPRAESM